MNITLSLQKWGNSKGVRLPKKILEEANFKEGQEFSLHLRGTELVLTPMLKVEPITLKSILRDATPERVGGELDWGPDVGQEIIDD